MIYLFFRNTTQCCKWSRQTAYIWAIQKASASCKNWFHHVKQKFSDLNLPHFSNIDVKIIKSIIVKDVKLYTMSEFKASWVTAVNRINAINGRGRNKLRTYRLFKQDFYVEKYCLYILPPSHRSAFCKFRCGVAPIRIETGRYENIAEEERKCPFCKDVVEDEAHVMLSCPVYDCIRANLLFKASALCDNYPILSRLEQLKFVFTHPSMIRICAKTCSNILKRRSELLCK